MWRDVMGTMTKLGSKQQLRLARVLAMLGSPNDCERAVAAKMATAFIEEHGLLWTDLTAHLALELDAGCAKAASVPHPSESHRGALRYHSPGQASSGGLLDYYG